MSRSDDEDEPRALATSHVKLLIEKCSSLCKKAMHVDSPNYSAADDVMNAGSGDFNNIVGTFHMRKIVKVFLQLMP